MILPLYLLILSVYRYKRQLINNKFKKHKKILILKSLKRFPKKNLKQRIRIILYT